MGLFSNNEKNVPDIEKEQIGKIILESKENLENETITKKRGRPKKSENIIENNKITPIPSSTLEGIIRLPYALVAEKTKYQGFNLSDIEAKAISEQANSVLLMYLPNLGEKAGILSVFIGTIIFTTTQKVLAYQNFKAIENQSINGNLQSN